LQPSKLKAQMAELVDASDSKSGVRKDVQVRFLFWAQKSLESVYFQGFLICGVSKMCRIFPHFSFLTAITKVK
jgi:hypothetical protein